MTTASTPPRPAQLFAAAAASSGCAVDLRAVRLARRARLAGSGSIARTRAPAARAILSVSVPRSPTPRTATRSPSEMPDARCALSAIAPSVPNAASSSGTPVGDARDEIARDDVFLGVVGVPGARERDAIARHEPAQTARRLEHDAGRRVAERHRRVEPVLDGAHGGQEPVATELAHDARDEIGAGTGLPDQRPAGEREDGALGAGAHDARDGRHPDEPVARRGRAPRPRGGSSRCRSPGRPASCRHRPGRAVRRRRASRAPRGARALEAQRDGGDAPEEQRRTDCPASAASCGRRSRD